MKIKALEGIFSVCLLASLSDVDINRLGLFFLGVTDGETSLVCRSDKVPRGALKREAGWRALRIEGVLDFSLVGVLSEISALLSKNNISIFAVSTYNTDYILTKEKDFSSALRLLKSAGHEIVG